MKPWERFQSENLHLTQIEPKISKYGQWTLEPFGGCANSFVHNTGFPQDQLPRGKGGDPTRSGVWFADYVAGEQGANTILAALYWRNELGGTGQFCEVSGAETQMDILDFDIAWYGFNASIKARTGAWDPNLNQYEWNPCRDGYMMIGGQTDRLWYRIGMCIERDFPQFGRLIHEDPILKEMGARNALAMLIKTYTVTTRWLRDINRVEAETKLLEYEIAAGPILYIDEVAEFPHFKYRPWVCTIETDHYCEWKSNMVPVTAIQNGPTLVYCNTDRTSQSQAGASEPRAGGTPHMRAALGSPCL